MKKLRLNKEEKDLLIKDVQHTFEQICKNNISTFEYTKKDVEDFLNTLTDNTVTPPTILINSNVYTKMYELVRQSPVEVQWHLLVHRYPEENEYEIYDILLFPQTNSGTSTTTDQDEFAEWQTNLVGDMDFPIEDLRGHGHSHVNMGVFSSSVDDNYQRNLITKVEDGDFYLFLVLNKKMEMCALLYDFEQQILFTTNDMTIEIVDEYGVDIRTWCTEQIKKYCKTAPAPARAYYSPYGSRGTSLKKDEKDDFISNITKPGNFWERRR